jgi:hypothetical protein
LRLPDRAGRVDAEHAVFVQCVDELDEALLLLPSIGFVEFDDERTGSPVRAIHQELGVKSFGRRDDGRVQCGEMQAADIVPSRDDQSP